MKTLFKHGNILLNKDGGYEVLKDGYLAVEDKTIAYIGKERPDGNFDTEKDMKDHILMPGLVNAHGHGPMTLVRGAGSGLSLHDWLYNAVIPLEDNMTPEHMYTGEVWAIAEMIRTGTTMSAEMYDFPWETGRAMAETGFKGNITRCGLSFSDKEEIPKGRFDQCIDLVKNWKDPSGRVKVDFSLHSEYQTTENFVRKLVEVNREYHRGIHVHISETLKEHKECMERHGGLTPVQYFDSLGVFSERTYAAHCVHVSEEDMRILKDRKVTVVHNPSSNCKLASGIAPINTMAAMGISSALGTDGCASNNNLNLFEEMHLSAMIRKALGGDPTVASAGETLRMATLNGARALGREDTGELIPGNKADIIAVSMKEPHMFPAEDIPSLLVFSAQGSDVDMTMVEGRILYEKGEYLTIDMEKARADMQRAIKEIHG